MHGLRSSAPYLSEEQQAALESGRYGTAIALMREMGWSWQELRDAPFDLVQELVIRISAERHWAEEKRRRDEEKRRQQQAGRS